MKKDVMNNSRGVKPPAGAPPAVVINTIDVRPVNRTTQDIPKWRNAIKSAEANTPRRTLLYDLYADVMHDGHVIAVTSKRIDAVTTANWQFVNKEGKPVDAINEVIDSIGFDDIVTEAINSKFWGYSILEPTFWKNNSGKWEVSANLLPRPNYRPHLGIVAYDWATDNGVNIREGIYAKTIMEVGKPEDLGLLVSAAQYAVLKRGGIGDYAMFVQVFGRPILDATWDGFDEAQRVKLQQSLDIGAGGTIIRPQGTELTILESKLTQSTIHGDFKKAMDEEISKALLGTTETTSSSNSSGYAQAKEHGEQDDNKHASDVNFVRKVLNSRFIKVLEAHGFNTEGGSFIIQGEETQLTTKESFEMHFRMATDLGLPMDDDFFYETYGVPKPENYNQMKANMEKAKANSQEPTPSEPKDPKAKSQKPKAKDEKLSWFQKQLIKLFPSAPAVTTGATTGKAHTVNLALPDTFDNDKLIQRAWEAKGEYVFDLELFEHTTNALLNGFKKGYDNNFIKLGLDLGLEYGIDDPAMLTAFEQNLFRFAGIKDLALLKRLNTLFGESTSFAEFYEKAKKFTEIANKDWLETEYNSALLVGEASANYKSLLRDVDIYPYWQYKTAMDEHVRESHAALEGIILRWDDPRWKKIFPPNGWNCRCYVRALMVTDVDETKLAKYQARADAYISSPEFSKLTAQGWGVNRASIGEVFTANQQYVNSLKLAYMQINQLGAKEFGLPELAEAQKVATMNAPINVEPLELTQVVDYRLRQMIAKNKVTEAVMESLQAPDEVWLQFANANNMVYIKYYADKTFVSIATLTDLKLQLNLWFELTGDALMQYRKGLLMYSK